ncbi:WD40-repeat-containing domain protein [Sporodiniella umbellata]|nr:WD40-repeat-containing domain protein [Sporodiniella umbellata]
MEPPTVFGLGHQARCLSAVKANTEKSQFLTGTVGAQDNFVCLLDYDDDNTIVSSLFRHPEEVWHIESCPSDPDLFLTCHSPVSGDPNEAKATLWKKPLLDAATSDTQNDLLPITCFEHHVKKAVWHPHDTKQVAFMGQQTLFLQSIEDQSAQRISRDKSRSDTAVDRFQQLVWNPHQRDELLTVGGCALTGFDRRSGQTSVVQREAHASTVRALDMNPNRPYTCVTGGDDALIKLWDTRRLDLAVMTMQENTHWLFSAAFNPLQDQLLLTSSSDALVHLYNVFSQSSAAHVQQEEEEEPTEKPKDGLVATFDSHEDSVYSVAWSAADAWTFASLSYSGRVVISQVPTTEKFKILGL